jgi:hypothetical protein
MSGGYAPLKKRAVMAVVLAAFLFGSAWADDAGKTETLNRALSEITELERNIHARIEEGGALLDKLNEQRELLKKEINQERRRQDISSFHQAVQNKRIDYNLRLVQQLTAYIERLNGSVEYFRAANQLLNFYARQARDDLLMLKTLQDADISGLMSKITTSKDEFEMMLNKPLFNASGPITFSMETIWNDIIKN